MIRKGIRPRLGIGLDLPGFGRRFRRVLPFRRSWKAMVLVAIADIIFLFFSVTTFIDAGSDWGQFDSLFDLVFNLFLSFWLLGWLLGPLALSVILAMLLLGREVIRARANEVEILFGFPLLGLAARYDVARMRNLRTDVPKKASGRSWRGAHLVFDYGANAVAFGSAVEGEHADELIRQIQSAVTTGIRRGKALPAELEPEWEPGDKPLPASSKLMPHGGPVTSAPLTLYSPSSLALILANLLPVAGILFFDWRLSDVMVLYWAESGVIGVFNLGKIIAIGRWSALFYGPFFVGHYSAFMAVHFLFIYFFFVEGLQNTSHPGGDLARVAQLFVELWPALLALFVSHGFSFLNNFLGGQEFRGQTLDGQMSEPYRRIIFMHLVIIFGGGLTMILGEPAPVLVIVIALKIYFDVRAHIRQHQGHSSETAVAIASRKAAP